MSIPNPNTVDQADAAASVRTVIQASRIAPMLYAMVELGLPALLANGPRTITELVGSTGAHAPSIHRLLRALESAGFVTLQDGGQVALTPRGAVLQPDAPGELAAQVRIQLSASRWRPWGELLTSVRTGRPSFLELFGTSDWEYQAQHPELAVHFNGFMSRRSAQQQAAILAAYDFSRFRLVVDVGGGQGQLLAAILQACPDTRGILFDQPEVVQDTAGILDRAEIRERWRVAGGNFFEAVPAGGDAYVLKSILHNLDDERAHAILQSVSQAMAPESTLLVMDWVLPEDRPLRLDEATADLNMLVLLGGKERTEQEFAALLDAAGFRLQCVIPTNANISIIEASRTVTQLSERG